MPEQPAVYVIAGAGWGLGSALVGTLGPTGATTVAIARRPAHLAELAKVARAKSWSLRTATADLTVQREVDAVISGVLGEFGHIDGVVVNAGRWMPGSPLIHETAGGEWEAGIVGNLTPLLSIARSVLPSMVNAHRGSLVIVSAAEAVRWAGTASYCAAKGALIDLGRKMARDYRPHGVRVNVVLPGNMVMETNVSVPPVVDGSIPLRSDAPTSPWEVARAIAFLLTYEGRWITGATITVDGGRSTWGEEQA